MRSLQVVAPGSPGVNKEAFVEAEQRYEAKRQMIALMQADHPWHKAAAIAGLHIGREASYQLLRNVHLRGEAALQDGRHGHPAKLRPKVAGVSRDHVS